MHKEFVMEIINSKTTINSRLNVNALLKNVYLWMSLGLAMTGVIAYLSKDFFLSENAGQAIGFLLAATVAELIVVAVLASRIHKMQANTAVILFIAYSMLNGFTISNLLLVYTGATVIRVFFITCGMFLSMGVVSLFIKKDLSRLSRFLMMALIGILVASVVNFFFKSDSFDYLLSFLGVGIFLVMTAIDTQKIIRLGNEISKEDEDAYLKMSILGALTLYLDFVNIFIRLLRLMERSKN